MAVRGVPGRGGGLGLRGGLVRPARPARPGPRPARPRVAGPAGRPGCPSGCSARSTSAWWWSTGTRSRSSPTRRPGGCRWSTPTGWRSPALAELVRRVTDSGGRTASPWSCRGRPRPGVPTFAVRAMPLREQRPGVIGGAAVLRRHRGPPAGAGPAGLRGQRLARAEDSGRRADPAGRGGAGGGRRPGRGAALRGPDAARGLPARPAGAGADRAVPAAGRRAAARRRRWSRSSGWSARRSTAAGCSPSRPTSPWWTGPRRAWPCAATRPS